MISAIIYYLSLPLIYLVSFSPDWILYKISDFLYWILHSLIGYRKKVVRENLSNSFPEKTKKELLKIETNYYKYLCDIILESIKTITMSDRYVRKHLTFHDSEMINSFYNENQSFLAVMGHFGNWEMAGPCFSLHNKHQLNVVYKPLSNIYFEKLFAKTRTKFNTEIIPMDKTLRAMAANKKRLTATALIADQTPSDIKTGLWIDFLKQDTIVCTGPEKIAKMFNYPVVYMHIDRVKRGFYEITPTVLFDKPKETEENEITIAFNKKLEEEIIKKPETWLWSHKRWKHKKKD